MVFVTFRWGNSAKRLGTDAPLMHFSPQRDVVMHCRPQRDVVMHPLSCNNSGCIKLNTDICGEIKSRHETVQLEKCEILYAFQSFRCVYVFHNILRNIALFTFIPVKIYSFKGLWIKDNQYLNTF